MPYVTQNLRKSLDADPKSVKDSGELSFQITEVIQRFLHSRPNGGWTGAIAPVLAALEGARIAFEEEIVKPYEEQKRKENGPVFEDWHHLTK